LGWEKGTPNSVVENGCTPTSNKQASKQGFRVQGFREIGREERREKGKKQMEREREGKTGRKAGRGGGRVKE